MDLLNIQAFCWLDKGIGQLWLAYAGNLSYHLKAVGESKNLERAAFQAGVVELVDALRSGRSARKGVGVQLPPPAGLIVEKFLDILVKLVIYIKRLT